MLLLKPPRGAGLLTLFAALLAGCSDRPLTGDEAGGTDSTDSSTSEPAPTTATTTAPSTTTSTSSGTGTGTGTSGPVTTSTTWPDEPPPECIYDTHDIVLTPEEYEAWLNGTAGETTGSTTVDTGTTTVDTGTTTVDTGSTTVDTGTTGTTGVGTDGTTGDGLWSDELCRQICEAVTGTAYWDIDSCSKQEPDVDGNVVIKCVEIIQHCDGRSHACITSRGAVALADPVVAHFARAAHDEAASVYAFAALADELAALGAPQELLARILEATADEVRHAEAVGRLVADRGGRCRPPVRRPHTARPAREIAIENAVEGCVRETWAALLAAHQASHAADPRVRAVMRTIAADEARHAELAWAIDAWLCGLLDPAARAEVEAARQAAATAVITGVTASEPAPALVHDAGLPGRAPATHLVLGLAATLWAA